MLKSTATWEPKRLYLDLLACKEISKKLKKSERCVVKWSSRNDGFRDKKRTGRPKILKEVAKKKILNKAKYKRGNSTRQLSQQLASKGHGWGKKHHLEVYEKRRLETAEKAKETSAHSQEACSSTEICSTVHKTHCGRMGWFSLLGQMSQIFVSAAESKKWHCLGFSGVRRAKFFQHISSKWIIWGGMTGCGLTRIHFLPQGQTLSADYYINNI